MEKIAHNQEYKQWLTDIKSTIKSRQLKAVVAVNSQLILLYWELGKMIVEKQESNQRGAKLIGQIATDLKKDLPDVLGFSRTNLYNMRQFYLFYRKQEIVPPTGGQIDPLNAKTDQNTDNEKDIIVQQPVGQLKNTSILLQIPWIIADEGRIQQCHQK